MTKSNLHCQKCKKIIHVDTNMVMLKDEIWLTHFNKLDILCDKCIEQKLNRKITINDIDDTIPCNIWWLYKRKGM